MWIEISVFSLRSPLAALKVHLRIPHGMVYDTGCRRMLSHPVILSACGWVFVYPPPPTLSNTVALLLVAHTGNMHVENEYSCFLSLRATSSPPSFACFWPSPVHFLVLRSYNVARSLNRTDLGDIRLRRFYQGSVIRAEMAMKQANDDGGEDVWGIRVEVPVEVKVIRTRYSSTSGRVPKPKALSKIFCRASSTKA